MKEVKGIKRKKRDTVKIVCVIGGPEDTREWGRRKTEEIMNKNFQVHNRISP